MKERIRRGWVTKEKYSCIKCGAGDNDIGWNDKGRAPAGYPEEVLFCKKCKHQLTTKEELEDLVPFVEVLEYKFFLRFAKEDFKPCIKCQEDLDEAFRERDWIISRATAINLSRDIIKMVEETKVKFSFTIAFLGRYFVRSDFASYEMIPCKKCQKKLAKILENANWILGNKDYDEPPIELKRTWVDYHAKQLALEKGKIITINDKPFGKCKVCKKEDFLKKLRCPDCYRRYRRPPPEC